MGCFDGHQYYGFGVVLGDLLGSIRSQKTPRPGELFEFVVLNTAIDVLSVYHKAALQVPVVNNSAQF